jgi:hypothetical protein
MNLRGGATPIGQVMVTEGGRGQAAGRLVHRGNTWCNRMPRVEVKVLRLKGTLRLMVIVFFILLLHI